MSKEETIYEEDVFEISESLCKTAKHMLKKQSGIIIDHVITSQRIFEHLIYSLEGYNLYMINVTCPLKELRRREAVRKNRCVGLADASYQHLYPKEGYDLVVDTNVFTSEECAQQIVNILHEQGY